MEELAARILNVQIRTQHDPFAAPVQTIHGLQYVDVLHTTGPGMLGEALTSFAGRNLRALREAFGEKGNDCQTWDAISVVAQSSTIIILPYCFFRSRGCAHLVRRFGDKVIFHHEFDTSWRPSFWHNYLPDHGQEL
eukprot:TRINITY_DN35808_c0_g1_i1.p1 TRINITY_DN35808_c0_g1~~TRINITY_DN35808_c0_g1_i1.p1  ORF type:complete len:156 (-),score=12.59 TRINITY_DN35808_c0_g1_i1:743-1150(-)